MEFKSLASSSHGNAYLVSDRDTRILVECGLSYQKLRKAVGFDLSQLAACLISHEHKDHSGCVRDLIGRGMDVYMSEGSADALELEGATVIAAEEQFSVGSFDCIPFEVFHDAPEPLGFLIKSRVDGDVLAFATDTVNLRYRFPGLTILAIEANFEQAVLEKCERMPEKIRRRIANSHMEIDVLCDYLRSISFENCREIYLLHLSDATSNEQKFIKKVQEIVPKSIKIHACRR